MTNERKKEHSKVPALRRRDQPRSNACKYKNPGYQGSFHRERQKGGKAPRKQKQKEIAVGIKDFATDGEPWEEFCRKAKKTTCDRAVIGKALYESAKAHFVLNDIPLENMAPDEGYDWIACGNKKYWFDAKGNLLKVTRRRKDRRTKGL